MMYNVALYAICTQKTIYIGSHYLWQDKQENIVRLILTP